MRSTQATPSSSALCASMGPAITSPIAYTPGTFVWKCASTSMRLRVSNAIPSSRAPSPSVNGRRPTATSSTSAVSVVTSPPAAGATSTCTSSPTTRAARAETPKRNFMPCFSSARCSSLAVPASAPGTMRSRYSSTVTSLPSRRHTEPNSSPIAPAPTTSSRRGTSGSVSASVLCTMRRPSNVMPGSAAGLLPVAISTRFACSRRGAPSPVTSTSWADTSRPTPAMRSTLFFLNSPSTPRVSSFTTCPLRAIIAGRSSDTPATFTPCAAMPCAAISKCSLESSSALLGMQPTLRHVPPSDGYFSMHAVRIPNCAARIAAT